MRQSHAASPAINPQHHSNLTIWIDLGDRWSRYCVLDQTGAVIEEDRVRTNEAGFRFRFMQTAARVVMEAGTHSPWVSRLLESLGREEESSGRRGAQTCSPAPSALDYGRSLRTAVRPGTRRSVGPGTKTTS